MKKLPHIVWHGKNNISKDETKNYLRDLCACEKHKKSILRILNFHTMFYYG